MNDSAKTPSLPSPPMALFVKRISVLLVAVTLALVTARLCDAPTLASANDRSRWCTVWSLVERNTYAIDEIRQQKGWDSIDIVRHDGHFYSSKPALLPRVVAELYRGLKLITGWDLLTQTDLTIRTLLFVINVLPIAVALFVWARFIHCEVQSEIGQIFLVTLTCFGTLFTPFLTVFNNHTIAISCFLIAIPLAVRCYSDEKKSSFKFALCGLLTAFGVCNELPAALLGIGFFLLLAKSDFRKSLTWFVPFACVPLVAFFITNHDATGSWKPFYSSYGTETYEFTYEGVPSYWSDPKGVDKPRDTPWVYFLHCTIGHHGIFSLSPIFLLTLLGWSLQKTWSNERLKYFQGLGLSLSLITLAFFLSRTQNYNYSGVSVALRWMLWLIPFWILGIFPVVDAFFQKQWFRRFSVVLLLFSIFSAWYPLNAPWTQPWVYRAMQTAGWINYSDAAPVLSRNHFSWIAQLPEARPDGEIDPDYWVRLESVNEHLQLEQIELRDAGQRHQNERLIQVVRRTAETVDAEHTDIVWSQSQSQTYSINRTLFEEGKPVEEFLTSLDAAETVTQADLEFFRGIPQSVKYVLTRVRYHKTPIRIDAFRTASVFTNARTDDQKLRVWRNATLSEELPFGILSWEERVQNLSDGTIYNSRNWNVVAAGKFLERQREFPF